MSSCSNSRTRRPLSLTATLEKSHFQRLGDLAHRPRVLTIELSTQALSLHNQHRKKFITSIKDEQKHQWLVVADQGGTLWLTERHCVPDLHLAHIIQTFKLKVIEQEE